MEGKIFSDSSNLYQDQAKVLFSYYKAAAEKIVSSEEAIEATIEQIDAKICDCKQERDVRARKARIGLILCWTIVGLFYYLSQNGKVKGLEQLIADKKKERDNMKKQYEGIFRDYRVDKLGVAYVPVASGVAFNDKSFIVDHTGSTSRERFTLQILRQGKLINESIRDLQDLTKSAPIIEASDEPEQVETGQYSRSIQKVTFHNYFGKLDRTLRTVAYGLGEVDETTVELPVIYPGTPYSDFLDQHATNKTDGMPVFKVFDTSAYDDDIARFNALNEMRKAMSDKSEQVDLTLRRLMVDMAESVQVTSAMKMASADTLISYSNRMLFNVLKAPYNFYSPVLEAEEIERIRNESFNYSDIEADYRPFNLRESSRMKFDLLSMSWVAENGSKTTAPFGISQIQEEIIAPIVSNLLMETRKDRLNIYNHIKDQKIDYLNQWHRDTEDFYGRNRAEASDLINLMRANLSAYTAAYNTLATFKKTEESMKVQGSLESAVTETEDNSADVLVAYQMQSKQFMETQQDFAEYMERLHDDIDAKAARFGHIEYYDASLRDRKAKDFAVAANEVGQLDERRKPLAEVSPLLAKESDLPPVPNVEELTYEHISLNLSALAKNAICELDEIASRPMKHDTAPAADEEFVCPECGKSMPADAETCPGCGCVFGEDDEDDVCTCSECGAEVAAEDEKCPHCGCEFGEDEDEEEETGEDADGEESDEEDADDEEFDGEEETDILICPRCGAEVAADAEQCPQCGCEIEVADEEEEADERDGELPACPECGEPVSPDADECPSCGFPLKDNE